MTAPVTSYFRLKVPSRDSTSERLPKSKSDIWVSGKNYQNSTDLQDTRASTEAVPMAPARYAPLPRSTSTSSHEKLISERTVQNVRQIAIMGIIGSILIAIIIVGLFTLIFSLQQEVPIGTVLLFSGNSLALQSQYDRWLLCDGSEVSRTTYRGLFAVIGTVYGAGNGIDTFNLPDFRSRFPLGSATSSDTSLVSGGNSMHTITTAELPAHSHNQGSLVTSSSGAHTHTYTDPGHDHGGLTGTGPFGTGTLKMSTAGGSGNVANTHSHSIPSGTTGITIQSSGSHTHAISGLTGTTGLGNPINILPPYQTVHYIIRT